MALSSISCASAAPDACLPPGVTYDTAAAAYQARHYAQASHQFEAVAIASKQCKRGRPLDGGDMELIVYEMLTAGDAAHWAGQNTRARGLTILARSFSRQFEALLKHDHDSLFALSLDDEQSRRDLAGTWTMGLRH